MADTIIEPEDYKWLKLEGDSDFSPERNKSVIASTIKKYNAKRRAEMKKYGQQLAERADAAAAFLKHVDMGKSTRPEEYFGRQELLRLQGRKILMKVLDKRNKFYKPEELN